MFRAGGARRYRVPWTLHSATRSWPATGSIRLGSSRSRRAAIGGRRGDPVPGARPRAELAQEPTAREIEVLQLISDGLVNREIGERLFLSEETVKSHVRHLLAKLQARSRAHAVAVGFRRGLID